MTDTDSGKRLSDAEIAEMYSFAKSLDGNYWINIDKDRLLKNHLALLSHIASLTPTSGGNVEERAREIANRIARHAEKPYPQWVEPGVYYVSLASEIEAILLQALSQSPPHACCEGVREKAERAREIEVLRKAKILSMIWTSKGEVDDPDALIAISEVHDAVCALYGVDPKVGFQFAQVLTESSGQDGALVKRTRDMLSFYLNRPGVDHEKRTPLTTEITDRECLEIANVLRDCARAIERLSTPAPTLPALPLPVSADGRDAWQLIETWTEKDGSHVLGMSTRFGGVAEFLHHDDGWTLATFNGQVIRETPTHWQPLPKSPLNPQHPSDTPEAFGVQPRSHRLSEGEK